MMRVALLVLVSLVPAVAWGNPSDRAPHDPLDLHGQEGAPELAAAAQHLFEKTRVTLQKIEPLYAGNKVEKIDAALVGKSMQQTNQLRRIAEQLQLLGEPAGIDFDFRAQQHSNALHRIISAMLRLPNASSSVAALRAKASQLAMQRTRQIPKLEKLLEQQKPLEADKELHEILDELEPNLCFIPPEDRASILQPFQEAIAQILPAAQRQRQTLAEGLLAKRREALTPDWRQFVDQIKTATTNVAKSGKHTVADKELAGPELIAHFDMRWQQLHVSAIKALAVEWGRLANQNLTSSPPLEQLQRGYAQASAEIIAALAALVQADANRVDPSSASALHAAYLPVIADLCDHAPSQEMSPAFAPALHALTAKSPELLAQQALYRAATDDLLRWRERVASEQALAKTPGYETLAARTSAYFAKGMDQPGLFTAEMPSPEEARLLGSAASILVVTGPKMIGQKVTTPAITALGSSGQAGIAQFDERIYARVALAPEQVAPQLSALRTLLRVTNKQPPLTLLATRALRGAQRGDIVQVGGEISRVYLEGHVTRFATLPDAAALLLPLGTLPDTYPDGDQLAQVVLRYDVQPHWWRMRYFVVDAK